MIALLAQAALAGTFGRACDVYAPIAGTAGFSNGLAAIRTQAATYGAGEFARRRLRGLTFYAWDMHVVVGAAQVPAICSDTVGKYAGKVYSQPLDMGATNLGLNLPLLDDGPFNSRAHVFYASSVTQSNMSDRAASWSLPLFNLYPATFAPLVGRTSMGRGLSVYALDWIGGAYLKSDIVSVQAGYTGTRGLYFDVTQEKVALFVNTVVSDGIQLSDAAYLMGGVQAFDPSQLGLGSDKVGTSSLFYRDLDQSDGPQETEEVEEVPEVRRAKNRLKTTHIRQEDMFRMLDVRATWQFGPQARLRELAAAIHSDNWYTREGEERDEDKTWYLRAGLLDMPDEPLLGVKGGLRPTLRGDYEHKVGSEGFGLRMSLRMNDPDLLDLYPFAYNALGFNFELSYTGGSP
jgi:hypothetical protein